MRERRDGSSAARVLAGVNGLQVVSTKHQLYEQISMDPVGPRFQQARHNAWNYMFCCERNGKALLREKRKSHIPSTSVRAA